MKNDAFSDNFPNKFFLSEAIHSGMLPLWNPYMNFGFPVYADPGFAFWNPVTWLFAIAGYNAYTLTLEVLLYIYLGGIFMYRFCVHVKAERNISIAIAVMYMCCGFYSGCLQYVNFITAAAFLPLLLQRFMMLQNHPSYKNNFWFAVSLYMIFVSGHPAIPVASFYFLLLFFVARLLIERNNVQSSKKMLPYIFVSAVIFIVLWLPALYSYISVWPLIEKNIAGSNEAMLRNGMDLSSFVSFLYPFATASKQNFFANDIAMRNIYFSLAGCIIFIIAIKSKVKMVYVFFVTGIFMLVLSVNGSFKKWIFETLPFLKYIRTNGEYRIFTILCFCAMLAYTSFKVNQDFGVMKKYVKWILGLSCIIFIVSAAQTFLAKEIFLQAFDVAGTGSRIKFLLDNAGTPFFLAVSAVISILLCAYWLWYKKMSSQKFLLIVCADMIINTIIYLPVTGIGQVKLADIQHIYNGSPEGIVTPALQPIKSFERFDEKTTGLIGDRSYYFKQPGTTQLTGYPVYFSSVAAYFKSADTAIINKQPFIFLKSDLQKRGGSHIAINYFSPAKIALQVNTEDNDTLVLLQNSFKNWEAQINKTDVPLSAAFSTFMSVPVVKGSSLVEFTYKDEGLLWCCIISLFCWIGHFAYLLLIKRNSKYRR